MNKEEALNNFLMGLRIVLNNAAVYPNNHPYFIKSVENFKEKVDILFSFLNPIIINITPNSLFMDGRLLDKAILYVDLAQIFHLRKIKSIEIGEGLTIKELIDFLGKVSLPAKEILKQGGIQNILNKEDYPHMSAEELDYSQLLRDEGQISKDIWVYLFGEAIKKEDSQQIGDFADNFERIIGKFKAREFFENEDLRQNIHDFLIYLKDKRKDKFYACSKDLLRFVLKDKSISQEAKLDKIKIFFQDLNKDDFTEVLFDEILKDDDFNYLSFQVFSRIIGEDKHKEIAPALEMKIKNSELLQRNPKIRKKVKELFSGIDDAAIQKLYRSAIYTQTEEILLEENLSFDGDSLPINYYLALVNLLAEEKDKERLSLILERLLIECNKIIENRKLEYLKFLLEVMDKKRKEELLIIDEFDELDMCICTFIENAVFEEESTPGLEYFVDKLDRSFLGISFYLDKIFKWKKVNSFALSLLLKFFPEDLPLFYKKLRKKRSKIDFLEKVVRSLKSIDSPLCLEILKYIFYFSNNIIKKEVLKSMQNLSRYDNEFLFLVLKNAQISLRREALVILARDDNLIKKALGKLLSIPNPLGIKNKQTMENIILVKELELKQAEDYLVSLSKRRFFWNRNIRKKASEVLKNWHA